MSALLRLLLGRLLSSNSNSIGSNLLSSSSSSISSTSSINRRSKLPPPTTTTPRPQPNLRRRPSPLLLQQQQQHRAHPHPKKSKIQGSRLARLCLTGLRQVNRTSAFRRSTVTTGINQLRSRSTGTVPPPPERRPLQEQRQLMAVGVGTTVEAAALGEDRSSNLRRLSLFRNIRELVGILFTTL
jgi:hypothetical protein